MGSQLTYVQPFQLFPALRLCGTSKAVCVYTDASILLSFLDSEDDLESALATKRLNVNPSQPSSSDKKAKIIPFKRGVSSDEHVLSVSPCSLSQ